VTGTATPPIAQQLHDAANGFVYTLPNNSWDTIADYFCQRYSVAPVIDPQLYHHQGLQHGFENMGLGENVYSPTRSRRRANKMKTTANATMNAYDFTVGAPVNPYAQTGADMFYQPQQTYQHPVLYP